MSDLNSPRLRTVIKVRPPFPLNQFPKDFAITLGKEIIYLLATKGKPILEGLEWEEIFATCIGAEWKPSNVGLDDIILGNAAWGAKTVKASKPSAQRKVRLISGRNSPIYSFGAKKITEASPNELGSQILSIWNERVSAIREKFKHLRTVVLIKSNDLSEVAVFEFETIRYDTELYRWEWNARNNLQGYLKSTNDHIFTWQPHGSQFTIIEKIPDDCLIIVLKKPPTLDKEKILGSIDFDTSWITISKRNRVFY